MMFFQKNQKSRDCPWDSSPKQSQEFWLSQSRPMGHKSLGLLGLGQKSLGQSRDFQLWDSNPRDKNPWDWQSRPMPIPGSVSRKKLKADSNQKKIFLTFFLLRRLETVFQN